MCGIAGFLDTRRGSSAEELSRAAQRMSDTLILRGPDDDGIWVDADVGIALGHRRLAILDLSREGRQPMPSHCGRYIIAYNGEVYNFRALRK